MLTVALIEPERMNVIIIIIIIRDFTKESEETRMFPLTTIDYKLETDHSIQFHYFTLVFSLCNAKGHYHHNNMVKLQDNQ